MNELPMKYNLAKALIFEITEAVMDKDPRWCSNWLIRKTRESFFNDWIDWREEALMKELDLEADKLNDYMDWLQSEREVIIDEDDTGETRGYTVVFREDEDY